MPKNRIRDQYANISVLLRRVDHVDNDYDCFIVTEESVEAARYRAAFNARKFFEINDENLVSWEDWLNKDKTKAIILGYTNKQPAIHYKGYIDWEKQPVPHIVQIQREREEAGQD